MPPATETPKVLVVDDDTRLADLIGDYLRHEGFEVHVVYDGKSAVDRIEADPPDVVVLDLMLPEMDGLSVCRQVRPHFRGAILMLTGRDSEIDQVVGLELGADDYVPKPASPRLLLARIRALLRRSQDAEQVRARLIDGDLVVDRETREVRVDEEIVDVTTAEFDLLWLLMENAGRPVDRETLIRELRGIAYDGLDRSIDVRVSQLRRKLEQASRGAKRIKTVRGVGYQFVPARS